MIAPSESAATLSAAEVETIASALASIDTRDAVLRAVEKIAAQRMPLVVFSASTCLAKSMEVERIYSSQPVVYPLGTRTNKRETSWGRQVLQQRKTFVGEGELEMAAAFDDKQAMSSIGVRSIINVPIVVRDRCLGVLNFGRAIERVGSADVTLAGLLAVVASIVFLP